VALGSEVTDPYMKMWEVQNQVIAMVQSAPLDAEVWLEAGNASAHLSFILAGRDEGDYFPDAIAMWAQALSLDASLQERLKAMIKGYTPPTLKEPRADPWDSAGPWLKGVQGWKKPPKKREFVQFLVEPVNGKGKCKKMCHAPGPPSLGSVVVLPMFSSRVLEAAVAEGGSEEKRILDVAQGELDGLSASLSWVLVEGGCWHRNGTASLSGLLCDTDVEVWFADPRGAWPEQWGGAVDAGAAGPVAGCLRGAGRLATEPKAPFHWHTEMRCEARHLLLFPAWLPFQVAPSAPVGSTRPFTVSTSWDASGAAGWRVPVQRPLCRGAKAAPAEAPPDPTRDEL